MLKEKNKIKINNKISGLRGCGAWFIPEPLRCTKDFISLLSHVRASIGARLWPAY